MEIFGFLFYFVLSTQKLPDLLCLEWETFLFLHHLIYKDKRHLAETFHMTSFRIGRTLSFYWGKIMLAQRENNGWERFGMCEDLSRSYIEPTGKRPLQRALMSLDLTAERVNFVTDVAKKYVPLWRRLSQRLDLICACFCTFRPCLSLFFLFARLQADVLGPGLSIFGSTEFFSSRKDM